ncbi:MAG: tyrosine-type recombinase/integrase, partial [Chloroflexota bacterium]
MSSNTHTKQKWALASYALTDTNTDFILSRQAMLCSARTLNWYSFTLGKVIEWLIVNGIIAPDHIQARHVRAYLSEMAGKGLSDSYINNHARAIRSMLRFFHAEKNIPEPITFQLPAIASKRLLVLSSEEIKKLVEASQNKRDKALLLVMVDTGLRRAEICALNWGDVDIASELVRVVRGKGGKARRVMVGATTRRALLAYRRKINPQPDQPLFQTEQGGRLSNNGLRSLLLRIGERAGVTVPPHALRRTFATMSLRAGMNLLHLQGLLGHSSIEMTRKYVQMIDDD